MKITCEHVVRCGNGNCGHNKDGIECCLKVVALDTTGKCAFVKPKIVPVQETVATVLLNDPNAC